MKSGISTQTRRGGGTCGGVQRHTACGALAVSACGGTQVAAPAERSRPAALRERSVQRYQAAGRGGPASEDARPESRGGAAHQQAKQAGAGAQPRRGMQAVPAGRQRQAAGRPTAAGSQQVAREHHCSCSELKNKCIDFFAAEKNFKKAVLTDGFLHLGQKFPSIIADLRERVGA
ncbi:hypothetical protein PAHAL_6G269600 [Panicum hallii]|uniref:BPM/SPOP BACK domain-containing protein n=1 Tax=Panicum hallii TaxID=206008 RepID=A0A2T8IHN8_9POAL|nr:hypothetical protein PAHAL_6G269600 [Panicum hallii]